MTEKKKIDPKWLETWVNKLDEEMDKAYEITLHAKKTKIRKPKRKR